MDDLLRAVKAANDIKDDIPSLIEEGLYLGSLEAANNKTLLTHLNSSFPPAYPDDFTYKTLDVHDRGETNIAECIDDCFGFINEAKRTGRVLVHCFAGRSRSVTVVVAYLMKTHGMSSSKALNLVKSKRSVAAPNAGFILQLQRYEKSLPCIIARTGSWWQWIWLKLTSLKN
ncbi:dual specificity protein phosphatase 1-like [Bidens hawaiensis]|uniref:dual specificity protein phosphatase 1-like n=1 Tax=Bidens hawaiensis TaxID=980011 RepID=UPI00404A96C0